MNGRVYDPALGRFLSADPNIQFVADLQSYNRYSYVLNNPLRNTDPTGYGTVTGNRWLDIGIGVGIAVVGLVACPYTAGAGCGVAFLMIGTVWASSTMLANGASVSQVATVDAISLFAGFAGGFLGSAIGQSAEAAMIGGAIGGATATALTDLELTGHLGWNILVGAAEGALAAAVGWGVKGDALSEAGAQGGGSGARRIEQGELRAALKAAVAEYGDDASALGEQEGAHYRLSDAGKAALKPLAEHLGVDLNDIEIKPTGAFGHPAITFGDTIHTDPSFAKENFDQQVDTLAHEMVHTAQYQQLGYVRFFGKYAVDAVSAWFGDYDRYAIPASIAGQNINDVSLTSGASLDAIAERYASEYGVNSRSYR